VARPKVGEERREEILTAFEACVVRKGFDKTTLIDVAEEAGQPRSLVRYFIGNRADMVSALIDRILERGEAKLRGMPSGGDVEQTLDLLLDAIFTDDTTNLVIMELWYLSLRDAKLRKRLSAIYERMIFEVAALIAGGNEDEFSRDRAFSAVSLAFGAAYFRHLGLTPNSSNTIRNASRHLLTNASPLPAKAGA
jgi:AcrR family transcriptional regulator